MTDMTTTAPASARRARIFAALGIGSALLSTFAGVDTDLRLAGWPYLPGIYFGAALALGAYLWVTKSPLRLLAIVIGVLFAWYLGFQTAIGVNLSLRELTKPYQDQNAFWITAFTGICGGFVGALHDRRDHRAALQGFPERRQFRAHQRSRRGSGRDADLLQRGEPLAGSDHPRISPARAAVHAGAGTLLLPAAVHCLAANGGGDHRHWINPAAERIMRRTLALLAACLGFASEAAAR